MQESRALGDSSGLGGPDVGMAASSGLTARTLIVAVVLSLVSAFWVREVEIVRLRCQVTESVPTIPALASLLLLAGLAALLHRGPRWLGRMALSRSEVLVVFSFVGVASVMSSVGVVRMFLPSITVPRYFAVPDNRFAQLAPNLPAWYAPRDDEVLRQFFEGSDRLGALPEPTGIPVLGPVIDLVRNAIETTGAVPWGAWATPLAVWTVFFTAYFGGGLALAALLRRRWSEDERLTFVLADFPISLAVGWQRVGGVFRTPWFWIGFGVACLHNVLNMLQAFYPAVPALGVSYPLGERIFTEEPLDALRGLGIWFRPETVGLAYFMPLDVLGSSTLFFFVTQVEAVMARGSGFDVPGAPFNTEQGMGSFVIIGLVVLWGARRSIAGSVRREPGGRWAALVLGLAAAVVLCIVCSAGFPLRHALLYFSLGGLVMVAHARIRAETGAPNVWLFPFEGQRAALLNFLGTEGMKGGANYHGATIFAQLFFLSRGYSVSVPATHLESLEIAHRAHISPRGMLAAVAVAIPVGLAIAFWMHLSTYYELGANVLEGGASEGGYRTYLAREAYQNLSDAITLPVAPDKWKMGATLLGGSVTLVLVVLRRAFLRFPINPLGFAIPTTLTYALWWPFLLAWILKSAVLHVGGVSTYRKLGPAFIGLALGHYFTAGIVWGVIAIIGGESTERYQVWFG